MPFLIFYLYGFCRPTVCYVFIFIITVDLYSKVKDESGRDNIILSPFSISAALAMTLAGARGETKSQMNDVLRFSTVPFCNVHLAFLELLTKLSSSDYTKAISIVNGLFVERHFR